MSLDLSPNARASARGRRIASHARIEAVLLLRNGEQLLLNLVIPVVVLVVGLLAGGRLGLDPRTLPASVMALALWSTGFTSLAINTGFERRYGVLERLAATPLTKADLVTGKALATAAIALGQLALLGTLGAVLGWRPTGGALPTLLAAASIPLAVASFAGLALALAGRLRAEATLGLANLIYLLVAAGGALVLPADAYPGPVAAVLVWLPFGALGEVLRGWALGAVSPVHVAVLAAWAILTLTLARKVFRWTS